MAITRARRGLVIVGHARTLRASGGRWAAYLQWLDQRGVVSPLGEVLGRLDNTFVRP